LGELFDSMREQGVYDNTRIIIITSDHGWNGDLLPGGRLEDLANMYGYNCLMMVKDFGSKGFSTSDDFMTNADTPTLAFDGLIENPVNPYTGNPVNSDAKKAEELHMLGSTDINIMENNGTRFKDAQWYGLKNQNALDMNNWRMIDDPSK
jgi:arylsulfatase A-like enzyme